MSPSEPPDGADEETVLTPYPFDAPAIENVTLPVAAETLIALAVPIAEVTKDELFDAAVTRPLASTVMLAAVYEPAFTPLLSMEIVTVSPLTELLTGAVVAITVEAAAVKKSVPSHHTIRVVPFAIATPEPPDVLIVTCAPVAFLTMYVF